VRFRERRYLLRAVVRLAPNAALTARLGLSRDHAVERTLHNCAVATIVEFNVDRPQDCDRNARSNELLHVQHPSSQWDEDVGFRAARNIQYATSEENCGSNGGTRSFVFKSNSIGHQVRFAGTS
jgi:hypothetical protein